MNLEVKDIPAKILPLLQKAKAYVGFAAVLLILGAFGFIVNQIRVYATSEPTEDQITERLAGVGTPRIDEEAVETVRKLESTNIDVKALFKNARDNPFQE